MARSSLRHLRLLEFGMALAWLASSVVANAQVTGTMSGYVKDPSGAFVATANVTATQAERSISTLTQTNTEGFYTFPALEPGSYTLTVEKEGFERYVRSSLVLTVRQNLRVDTDLQLGAVTKTVNVTSEAPLVDTASGTVSSLVDDRRIVDLPLNGRNVMSLAQLVPGVLGVQAPEYLSDARGGPQMNANGGRGNQNLYTFDGAFFNNPSRNTGMNFPPPDAVQEFRLLTSNFDAEYGRNSGSQATVVARAGGNDFHGDVWEFLRNDALNARNFFASTVPVTKKSQFGGAAGGPIKKEKLFFFGSYQGLRNRGQAVAQQTLVPSAAERTGNFTDLLPGTVLVNPVNPNTGAPFTTPTGAPCIVAGTNIIDPSCVTAPSKNLLQYVPVSSSGSVVSLGSSPINDDTYLGRIDANISRKHSLFGHAYVDHNSSSTAFPGGNLAGYNSGAIPAETDSVALNDTYTFRPTLVNQAVVAFLRSSSTFHLSRTQAPADIGINMPEYSPNGTIGVSVSGGFNLQGGGFNIFKNNNVQFRDTLTWINGRHEFKMGGELLKLHFLQRFIGPPGFSFTGSRSGAPFADYLLGAFSSAVVGFGLADNDDLTTAPSFFFQDQFKLRPRFTLTYGLRWEPSLFWYDKHNRIDTVQFGAQSKVVPDAPPGIVFPGDPGIRRTIVPPELNSLAPRVGFAWDVFGNGKTSVRGGYGVFYNQLNADSLAQQNAPFSGVLNLPPGNWTDPFGSTGVTPAPVFPTKFGCVPIAAPPGFNCPLYPLPVFGYFVDLSLRTPYSQSWNLWVQRQLTPSTMLEMGYVGNAGIKLNNIRNFNPARFIPGTVYNAATGNENTVSNPSNVTNRAIFEPGILGPLSWTLGNDFRSWYHSFQTQLTRRMSKGVTVTASYTLAKAVDMCSFICEACGCVSNPFDLRSIRGRANFDRRHAVVASWLWSPPVKFSEHWKTVLLDGWSFSGITSVQSGMPMTFSYGSYGLDVAVDGNIAPQHAFPTGQPIGLSHSGRNAMVNEFFNTAAFVNPTCTFTPQPGNANVIEQENCAPFGIKYSLLGKFGATGRNILSGPASSNTDFAVLKDFSFKERYRVEFRSEFFNFLNQVNFRQPDSTVTDGPAFGTIQGANPGRVIQFGLKFFW